MGKSVAKKMPRLVINVNQEATIKLDPAIKADPDSELPPVIAKASGVDDSDGTRVRVERKEKLVELGMSSLARLTSLMEGKGRAFPECRKWVTQASMFSILFQSPTFARFS